MQELKFKESPNYLYSLTQWTKSTNLIKNSRHIQPISQASSQNIFRISPELALLPELTKMAKK